MKTPIKVSRKHQVVIPKAARKKMRLPDGSYMVVKKVTPTEITFAVATTPVAVPAGDDIMRFAGIAKDVWSKHPTAELRTMRDSEWD